MIDDHQGGGVGTEGLIWGVMFNLGARGFLKVNHIQTDTGTTTAAYGFQRISLMCSAASPFLYYNVYFVSAEYVSLARNAGGLFW